MSRSPSPCSPCVTSKPIVVLGGGTSAGYFAAEYVKLRGTGEDLCIVSSEDLLPYERPYLSKGYWTSSGSIDANLTCAASDLPHGWEWYQQHGITVHLGTTCTRVTFPSKTLHLHGPSPDVPRQLQWTQALVIATGAGAAKLSVPGDGLSGIHVLRDVKDAAGIKEDMARFAGGKAVVVGGGYIGMECAAVLAGSGMEVAMVFPHEHLMPRLFTPEIAAFYESELSHRGVRMVCNTTVHAFLPGDQGDRVGAVQSSAGDLPCDLVVTGIGSSPRIDLFKDSLTTHLGGLAVDHSFMTSEPMVYAIGDVATFPVSWNQQQYARCEHVIHCRAMAQRLAHVLYHTPTSPFPLQPYLYFPVFYSRIFDLSWRFWGDVVDCGTACVTSGRQLLAVWVRDGELQGALLESGGDQAKEKVVRQAVETQIELSAEEVKAAESVAQVLALFQERTMASVQAAERARATAPRLKQQLRYAVEACAKAEEEFLKIRAHVEHLRGMLAKATVDGYPAREARGVAMAMVHNEFGMTPRHCPHVLHDAKGFGMFVIHDSRGRSTPSNDAGSQAPQRRRKTLLSLFLLTTANIVVSILSQYLFFRELYSFQPFPFFATELNTLVAVLISGTIHVSGERFAQRLESLRRNPDAESATLVPTPPCFFERQLRRSALAASPSWNVLAVLGILFSFVNILQIASTTALGPTNANLTTLLTQFTIPFSAIGCRLFLKTQYTFLQVAGCALVIAGVATLVSTAPTDACALSRRSFGLWVFAYVLSCGFQAAQNVVTQGLFKQAKSVTLMDMVHLVFWLNTVSLLVSPLSSIAFGSALGRDVIREDYVYGAQCLFGAQSSLNETHTWDPASCEKAWVWVVAFAPCTVLYVLANAVVVVVAGATYQFLATALTLPFINVVLASKALMGPKAGNVYPMLWLGLGLILAGMMLHEHRLLGCSVAESPPRHIHRHSPSPTSSPRSLSSLRHSPTSQSRPFAPHHLPHYYHRGSLNSDSNSLNNLLHGNPTFYS